MPAHPSDELLARYRERTATALQVLEVDDHLAACVDCRQRLVPAAGPAPAYTALRTLAAPGAPPEHLTFEQLAGFVDGDLDPVESEIVLGHVDGCELCTAELRDLRAFRGLMSTHPRREFAPAAASHWWDRLRVRRGTWLWAPLPALGSVAGVAALVFILGVRPVQMRLQEQQAENSGLARSNEALGRQVAELPALRRSVEELERKSRRERERGERLRREAEALRQRAAQARQAPAAPTTPPRTSGLETERRSRLALRDGPGDLTSDASGNLVRVERVPGIVAEAMRSGRLPEPVRMAEVQGLSGYVRGAQDEGFAVRGPGGEVVEPDRPRFRWTAEPGATTYRVSVYGQDLQLISQSELIAGTEWTPAEPLTRGKVYQWEVVAYRGEQEIGKAPRPPAPEARFRILEVARLRELHEARRRFAGSHLVLGVLYARAGLLEQAETELAALAAANPGSRSAGRLLEEVRRLRRPATR